MLLNSSVELKSKFPYTYQYFNIITQCYYSYSFKDRIKAAAVPQEIRNAYIKLQYGRGLPDPNKYLAMFVGLPSNYRKSILADVSKQEDHVLENVVCRNPLSKGQQVAPEAVLQFEIQINRISGVPTEANARKEDVLHRSVRFSLCKTNKPATPDQTGNPPEFLGDATLILALLSYIRFL